MVQYTDRSRLESLLAEEIDNSLGLYTEDSFHAYEIARAEAQAVFNDPIAVQLAVDMITETLSTARQALSYRIARVNIQVVDQDSGEFVDLIFLEEGFGSFFLTELPSYAGYSVTAVRGNATYVSTESGGLLYGMAEWGATIRIFVGTT